MKKVIAVFCALVLMPMFSAHAWIGGPFSNNSHFGPDGDDGVYEAVGTAENGLGIYRIVVGNNFEGVNPTAVQASIPAQALAPGSGTLIQVPGLNSGNIFFGGLGSNSSNIWYYEGVSYFGNAIGTINSTLGIVVGLGSAFSGANQTGDSVSSFFQGRLSTGGRFLPARSFTAAGELRDSTDPDVAVPIMVFGSKVSNSILFGL